MIQDLLSYLSACRTNQLSQETTHYINDNNNPICNVPGASFTDPELRRTLHNIADRTDR